MSKQYPLVSVAVTTYNASRFIREQMESLLNQDYSNKEIIVCDDFSTDDTFNILTKYANQHSCIKLYHNSTNIGFIKNFEKAISLCEGEYIALCDHDDVWLKNKLSLALEKIGRHALIYHDSFLIDENGNDMHKRLSEKCPLGQYNNYLNFALGHNILHGHTMIFKKDLVSEILPLPTDTPSLFTFDSWIGLIAILDSRNIVYLDTPLVKYRQHSQSVIAKRGHLIECNDKLFLYTNHLKLIQEQLEKREIHDPTLGKLIEVASLPRTSFSIKRLLLYLKNKETLLAHKQRSPFRKLIYCFKMLFRNPII